MLSKLSLKLILSKTVVFWCTLTIKTIFLKHMWFFLAFNFGIDWETTKFSILGTFHAINQFYPPVIREIDLVNYSKNHCNDWNYLPLVINTWLFGNHATKSTSLLHNHYPQIPPPLSKKNSTKWERKKVLPEPINRYWFK